MTRTRLLVGLALAFVVAALLLPTGAGAAGTTGLTPPVECQSATAVAQVYDEDDTCPTTSASASASASPSASGSKSPSASPSVSKPASSAPAMAPSTTPAAVTLPVTGPGTWRLAAVGAVLLAGGVALVVASRRRRARGTS